MKPFIPPLLRGQLTLLPGLPDVDDRQQAQHRPKQQGGDGVDLRTDAFFGHGVDAHGQVGGGGAGGEVADDEIVNAHGEGRQRTGDDAGLDLRDNDLPEGLHPGAAQVHSRVHQIAVHLPQLGADGEDHIGDVERDMGDEQRPKAHGQVGGEPEQPQRVEPGGEAAPTAEKRYEQQAHGNTGDDIRVHHGDVVDGHQRIPDPAAHGVKADGGEGPGHSGDDGCQQGHQQGGVHALHDDPVAEELRVPTYKREDILEKNNVEFEEVERLEDALPKLDILYMTRVQKERFFNEEDYVRMKDFYILDKQKMELAPKDMYILHPLPRVNEIAVEVDDDPRAAYFKQAQYGVYVRMALILRLLEVEV